MKRRDSLKTLLLGAAAGATLGSVTACKEDGHIAKSTLPVVEGLYGRTPAEVKWDKQVEGQTFLNEQELSTIATCLLYTSPSPRDRG